MDLFADLNTLSLYAWGDRGCCLPRGTTRATLRGLHPDLSPGDMLVFQEVVSPTTFVPEDADRAKRWVVRLTEVKAGVDPSGQLFDEPPVDGPVDVTEIAWDAADALPFPLCLSVKERPGLEVSVALRQHRAGRPRADGTPTSRWTPCPCRGLRASPPCLCAIV